MGRQVNQPTYMVSANVNLEERVELKWVDFRTIGVGALHLRANDKLLLPLF